VKEVKNGCSYKCALPVGLTGDHREKLNFIFQRAPRTKNVFLLILCGCILTILDNFPDTLPREGYYMNMDASLDG
jgi:hypothetical protein